MSPEPSHQYQYQYLGDKHGAEARISWLLDAPEYSLVLRLLLGILNADFTAPAVIRLLPILSTIVEMALDSRLSVFGTTWITSARWHDLYPPAKLVQCAEILAADAANASKTVLDPASIRQNLKAYFAPVKSCLACPIQTNFFDLVSKTDPKTFQCHSEHYRPGFGLDIFDYYTIVYFGFKEFEFKNSVDGAWHAFNTGRLAELEDRFPPVVFAKGGVFFQKDRLDRDFINSGLFSMFSNILAMDDLYFGSGGLSCLPFEDRVFFAPGSEWDKYQTQRVWQELADMIGEGDGGST